MQQRGDLMRERHHVVNRYRYINTLKQKFKAGKLSCGQRASAFSLMCRKC